MSFRATPTTSSKPVVERLLTQPCGPSRDPPVSSALRVEGGLTTISPIACLDLGFGTLVFCLSHTMSHRKRSIRPALTMAGLHGCGAATELRTSSPRPVWCGRVSC